MNADIVESPILVDIFGKPGYSTAFAVTDHELAYLRTLISKQWITRIESAHPEQAARFREVGLERYHELSHLISHSGLWPKEQRVMAREAVAKVLQLDFISRLRTLFGVDFRIADVVFFSKSIANYPEIYWRLVRPGAKTDVGGMHTDRWFHDILGNGEPLYGKDETTIKMWLPVFTESGRNGLYVVPGSHLKNWSVKYTSGDDGFRRPSLDEPLADNEKYLVPVQSGQAVLFNENLLHGGAVNAGLTTRVSIEITFVLNRSVLPQ